MITTPEQQRAAADAARKEGEELSKKNGEEPQKSNPAPNPEPMAGSKTGLQQQAQPAPTSPPNP